MKLTFPYIIYPYYTRFYFINYLRFFLKCHSDIKITVCDLYFQFLYKGFNKY